MGIGCGGPSLVGKRRGLSVGESVKIVERGLDAGVNLIDTSEANRTEHIVGRAIRHRDRDALIISSKKTLYSGISQAAVQRGLERSLRELGTDYIDIYSLYGVLPDEYGYFYSEIVPVLEKMRDQGKVRFLGITERFNADPRHAMLDRALNDDIWDVVMVGFNMLNQSARDRIFSRTTELNIGVQVMFAVRFALSRPARLDEVLRQLVAAGQLDPGEINSDDPLGFLVHDQGAKSIVDAAYRFCRHEPGAHVVLSGTGNPDHMAANIESLSRPPLPEADLVKLRHMFRLVDSVSGQ